MCLFLIVISFTSDQIIWHRSKQPKASGIVLGFKKLPSTYVAHLKIEDGSILQGEYFSAGEFTGTLLKVNPTSEGRIFTATLEGGPYLKNGVNFRVYSTIFLSNIALLIDSVIVLFIFYYILRRIVLLKYLTLVLLFFSVAFWFNINIIKGEIHLFNGFLIGSVAIPIIICSMSYYYIQINKLENLFIYKQPSFWIVSGILIYKSATFFLFLYTNNLEQSEKAKFYVINSIFYIIQNIFFTISFTLKDGKTMTVSKTNTGKWS